MIILSYCIRNVSLLNLICIISMFTILYICTYFITIWTQIAPGQLDFQFLAQDFQITEGGSQNFLIQMLVEALGQQVIS